MPSFTTVGNYCIIYYPILLWYFKHSNKRTLFRFERRRQKENKNAYRIKSCFFFCKHTTRHYCVSSVGGEATLKYGNRRPNPDNGASACVAMLYQPIFTYHERVETTAFQLVCGWSRRQIIRQNSKIVFASCLPQQNTRRRYLRKIPREVSSAPTRTRHSFTLNKYYT